VSEQLRLYVFLRRLRVVFLSSPVSRLSRYFILVLICVLLLLVAFSPQTLGLQQHHLPELDELPPLVPRDLVFGVTAPSDGPLFMVGNQGKILTSEDGGKTWNSQKSPVKKDLIDVKSWDSDRLLAVGNGGSILRTDNGGESWTRVNNPYSKSTNKRGINKIIRASILDGGDAWAVGQWNMIMETSDYGKTWRRISKSRDRNLYGVDAINPNFVIGVGEFGTILQGKRNQGDTWTWTSVESPVKRSLKGIEFRNDNVGMIVGLKGTILRTTDGGSSWNVVHEGKTGHLYEVHWPGDRWFAVGGNGAYAISSDGQNWTSSRLAATEFGWHTGIAPVDQNNNFLVVGGNVGTFNTAEQHWNLLSR